MGSPLLDIYLEAVRANHAGEALKHWLKNHPPPSWSGRVAVAAVGKAASAMARAWEQSGTPYAGGLLVAPSPAEAPEGWIRVQSSHPLPDENSLRAGEWLLDMAARADILVLLLSGGASSLCEAPPAPLTLDDLRTTGSTLLNGGLAIGEINTVRRHLSRIKGGGLLEFCRGEVLTLAISDVPGDAPQDIGSGPGVPDPSTLEDARRIIERRGLMEYLPGRVTAMLEQANGRETLKPGTPAASRARISILANHLSLRSAAMDAARRRFPGLTVSFAGVPVSAPVEKFVEAYAPLVKSKTGPCLFIGGGEPHVRVAGSGKGGRSCHLAALMARAIAGTECCFLAAGSDGLDGDSGLAGALVNGESWKRVEKAGRDPGHLIAEYSSAAFHHHAGGGVPAWRTDTNVMDLHLLWVGNSGLLTPVV
ncbi:MAG: D-glycerate 2-kinase [Myxococcota bacterium]|nr:D-glycerate 2-kinase [Myxococcota bacterium]